MRFSLRAQLSLMMFLNYVVWGAWYVTIVHVPHNDAAIFRHRGRVGLRNGRRWPASFRRSSWG